MSEDRRLDLNTLDFNSMILEPDQWVSDAILIVRSSLPGGISRCTTLVTKNIDFLVARGMAVTLTEAVMDGGLFKRAEGEDA